MKADHTVQPTTIRPQQLTTYYTTLTLSKLTTFIMPDTFKGWLGKDKESVNGKMEWGDFEPKKWTEDDVDIEISHCGICGSDLHMLSSGWGPTPYRMPSFPPFKLVTY
jgi:hypothetical protein